MAKITVTIPSKFVDDVLPAVKDAVNDALPDIASFALDRIGQQGDLALSSQAGVYREGFGYDSMTPSEGGGGFRISPTTPAAEALEEGYDTFDMKDALLSSSNANVKQDKNGVRYVNVPFRHGASVKATRLQGMPSDVKAKVDKVVNRERGRAKRAKRAMPEKFRVTGSLQARPTKWKDLKYGNDKVAVMSDHKTSIHSDMIRSGAKQHVQYHTIRRISDNSDADSWQHPGFAGVKGLGKVAPAVEAVALKVITKEIRKLGLKAK